MLTELVAHVQACSIVFFFERKGDRAPRLARKGTGLSARTYVLQNMQQDFDMFRSTQVTMMATR